MSKIRGTHSSPGIYTEINDLQYKANSVGITTLGLVGETLKGPAFEPIKISDWPSYTDYFGGTSPAKFKDTQYPQYELPYIAQSYLKKSNQVYVCRVLGLSGYNAGPAFVITAFGESDVDKENNKVKGHVIAVLRSRGKYQKYGQLNIDKCQTASTYDELDYACDTIELTEYVSGTISFDECKTGDTKYSFDANNDGLDEILFPINSLNYGRFTIVAKKGDAIVGTYPVSLNAGAKDYIYSVLGGTANDGNAAVFVEELYDYKLQESVDNGEIKAILAEPLTVRRLAVTEVADPVLDFVTLNQSQLTRKNVGQTFIYDKSRFDATKEDDYPKYAEFKKIEPLSLTDGNSGVSEWTETPMKTGEIYVVKQRTDDSGKKVIYYAQLLKENKPVQVSQINNTKPTEPTVDAVNILKYDTMVYLESENKVDSLSTVNDMNDYKEQFRSAMTPWVVSELKNNFYNPQDKSEKLTLELKKLFRFHTITDGNDANREVKISIANIRPDDGTFDVYVRDFDDSDGNPTILESYKKLTMVPGDKKYIGLQIGTIDGTYEVKSKYVMVEVIEDDMTAECVPSGFMGYPVRSYGNYDIDLGEGKKLEVTCVPPSFKYNTVYDEDIKSKKQYFGLSDITGVDVDILTYKGKNAYSNKYKTGYTNGFHLDSTLALAKLETGITITIDGEEDVMGWDTVNVNNVTSEGKIPVIGTESSMEGTIYEDVNLRKFTLYPYGGFDGWDIYRKSRTNTDEYKANKYKGNVTKGSTSNFSKIYNGDTLNLSGNAITTDYYAYLAGYKQFENPELYQINLFATPGIDYVNNGSLVNEVISMLEEDRKDTFYVVTTPDKPSGASDAVDEMYSSSDASSNLDDSSIDTYYAASYYPWVKYYDSTNNMYINLPATKDVLRNMADVDNKKYPWIAPAGIERGDVECVKTHFFAKLEDEDNVYENRINPIKTFSKDGVKVWGEKTLYTGDTPMNRINTVRLVLYLRKLINESCRRLIFEPNDTTLKDEFRSIVEPILQNIKVERGIVDFRLDISQTVEEMDAHEMNCKLWVKPTPTLEYIGITFMVSPLGVDFDE